MNAVFFFIFYIFIICMIVACGKMDEPILPLEETVTVVQSPICELENEDNFNTNPLDCIEGSDEFYEKARKRMREKDPKYSEEEPYDHTKS